MSGLQLIHLIWKPCWSTMKLALFVPITRATTPAMTGIRGLRETKRALNVDCMNDLAKAVSDHVDLNSV